MNDKPLKVLLIEDNPGDARLIQEMVLQTDPSGFHLILAQRLDEGLKRLKEDEFDVVLLDLGLPDSSGLDTFTRLYAAAPHLPTIVVTGLGDEATAVNAVRSGAQDYLVKGEIQGPLLVRAIRYAIERKQHEQVLDYLASIVEQATDSIIVTNFDYEIQYANQATEDLYGYSREELKGATPDFLNAEPMAEDAQENIYGKVASGEAVTWAGLKKRKDGSTFICESKLSPLLGKDGKLLAYIGIQRDITERRRMEEALRQERDKAQKYLDVAGVILVAIDANQKVNLINKQGCEILGCPEEEIVGKNWFDNFVPERVRDETVAIFDRLMAGEIDGVEYFENPVLTKSGGETLIAWHNTVLTDERGDITGVLASGQDITVRQLLWKKMVEYEELTKLKSDLLSMVSHELRTPLAIIKGYSTMLVDYARRLSTEEREEHLVSIDKATDRLTELVDHLLDMSRMDAGLLKLERMSTSISKVIEQAAAEAQLRAPEHNIVVHIRDRLPTVNIDAKRIRQVLDNLIDNACKYSEEGTEVAISARQEGQELVVSVADQGAGIPAEDLERVFDRMYRAEQRLTPKAEGLGLGLGLSICKGLVEAHSGRIWVESEPGKGSTFYFALPLGTE